MCMRRARRDSSGGIKLAEVVVRDMSSMLIDATSANSSGISSRYDRNRLGG